MYGIILISLSVCFETITYFYKEARQRQTERLEPDAFKQLNTIHLSIQHITFTIFIIGLSLTVRDLNNPFLSQAFNPLIWFLIWVSLEGIIIIRQARFLGLLNIGVYDNMDIVLALEETISSAPTPEEGFNHVKTYIDDHQTEFREDTWAILIKHLSKRHDKIGTIAKSYCTSNSQ
jgi:hypothetical protein